MAPELLKALHFAAEKHRDQRRKDVAASPYINHPIEVAEILSRHGVSDVVTLQAAILHDTIEDTETTADELREIFGEEVCSVVLEVTDDKSLDKDVRKELQIQHAPHLSQRAQLVKLADKIANVSAVLTSPPADWPLSRRIEYLDWAERVVAGLRGAAPELEALFYRLVAEGREHLQRR